MLFMLFFVYFLFEMPYTHVFSSSVNKHYTVRQHLVIVQFLLLLLLSGTLFQMMSGVPHHCHHLSLV